MDIMMMQRASSPVAAYQQSAFQSFALGQNHFRQKAGFWRLVAATAIPISRTLIDEGLKIALAVDASPKMVSAFRQNFPGIPVKCEAAEQLSITGKKFDAALAWGLMFLLPPENQQVVIENISRLLNSGGKFLFTSPRESATWTDIRTGRKSVSLGASQYQGLLLSVGMSLIAEYDDEGSNHYYEAEKE